MTYGLWLFPPLAGYFIISKFIYFKYKYQRLGSQRLIFHSIFAGILSFGGFYVMRMFLSVLFEPLIPWLYLKFNALSIPHQPLMFTAIMCFAGTILGVLLINWVLKWRDYFNFRKPVLYAVDEFGDELKQLFKHAAINQLLLQITLQNRKVYVGYADTIPPPKESNYLKIIPVLSGYRDPKSLEIHFTTDYFKALKAYQDNTSKNGVFGMDTVIKQDEILSARNFDLDVFNTFNKKKDEKIKKKK